MAIKRFDQLECDQVNYSPNSSVLLIAPDPCAPCPVNEEWRLSDINSILLSSPGGWLIK